MRAGVHVHRSAGGTTAIDRLAARGRGGAHDRELQHGQHGYQRGHPVDGVLAADRRMDQAGQGRHGDDDEPHGDGRGLQVHLRRCRLLPRQFIDTGRVGSGPDLGVGGLRQCQLRPKCHHSYELHLRDQHRPRHRRSDDDARLQRPGHQHGDERCRALRHLEAGLRGRRIHQQQQRNHPERKHQVHCEQCDLQLRGRPDHGLHEGRRHDGHDSRLPHAHLGWNDRDLHRHEQQQRRHHRFDHPDQRRRLGPNRCQHPELQAGRCLRFLHLQRSAEEVCRLSGAADGRLQGHDCRLRRHDGRQREHRHDDLGRYHRLCRGPWHLHPE